MYGLALAVEAMVVADIAGTSGVQTQAYSTSVLQTLRKSLTKLETTGYTPGFTAINPVDFEAIELALSSVTASSTNVCRSTPPHDGCWVCRSYRLTPSLLACRTPSLPARSV
jgi:hypothetical protein